MPYKAKSLPQSSLVLHATGGLKSFDAVQAKKFVKILVLTVFQVSSSWETLLPTAKGMA